MSLRTNITIVFALFFMQFLQAQESEQVQRKGFVFGMSIGATNTSLQFPDKSEKFSDLGLDLRVGYMINPKLAILLTSNVSIYDYSGFGRDRKRDFGVVAPSVQYWLHNKVWIQGGVGIGGDNPVFWDVKNPDTDILETKYYSGLGFVAAVGYEVYQSKNNFTVDVKARTMYRKVDLQEGSTTGFTYGLLVGFNFY